MFESSFYLKKAHTERDEGLANYSNNFFLLKKLFEIEKLKS